MSLQRRIDFTERVNATLRWDIFNVFDRANLGLPDSNIVNATAGVISTARRRPAGHAAVDSRSRSDR